MTQLWLWFTLAFAALVGAIFVEGRVKRGRHRSLTTTFKGDGRPAVVQKPALGMEATDVAGFNKAMAENNGLARVTGRNRWQWHSHTAAHSRPPLPLPDDETYAARFHGAFGEMDKDHTRDRN